MFKKKIDQPTPRVAKQQTRSAGVFSYHANRSNPENRTERFESEKKETTKQQSKWQYLPGYIAGLIIIIAICYSTIIDTQSPKVVPLAKSTPTILRDTTEYEQGIAAIMNKSIWNHSKLTINTKDLARQIQEQFTELGSVAVTMPLVGRRPIVQIAPADPVLVVGAQGNGMVVVGADGRALMSLNELSEDQAKDLIHVEDTLNTQVKMGELLLSARTVQYIQSLKSYFNQKSMVIESIKLPAVANEVHIKLKDVPYVIKFNMQADPRQQVGSYVALIESLKSQNKSLPKEYVDVRVDDRVFYK